MTSQGSENEIGRSRDGVPRWSGEAGSFQEYEEQALQWEQGIAYHKRYLCGPRLVAELSGTARKFVTGKRPDWLSYEGGVQYLMEYLRASLGKPRIAELTEYLNRYFRQSRRRRMESMNDYIVRKSDLYSRARQALSRVQGHYETQRGRQTQRSWSSWGSSWGQWSYGRNDWGQWQDPEEPGERGRPAASNDDGQRQEREESYESLPEDSWQPRHSSWGTNSSTSGWNNTQEDEEWLQTSPELLPDFLQGWYLLMDSGLDSQERNMVQTAVRGNFSLQKIAHELRAQWPEDELKRRDQQLKQNSFWQEDLDEPDHHMEPVGYMTAMGLMHEGMNEEGIALVGEAEEQAQEALQVLHQAHRTLREARAKQHQIKMNRQYYQSTSITKPKMFDKNQTKPAITCFKCGGPHKIAQCPDRDAPGTTKAANVAEEAAPFICFHEGQMTEECLGITDMNQRMTTDEAIKKGYGVIDGGATKTLASVYALEALQHQNIEKYQDDRVLRVDPNNTPSFGFGNSSKNKCCSTATLKITADQKPGELSVHALDQGTGPMLLSVDTLRRLGAVIDFAEDLVVFRNLDDRRVIQAVRSQAGHQLLPISDDLYRDAKDCKQPVPSLRDFCKDS